MTRKELERLLAEAASLADRLAEPLEGLSSDELDVALAEAGSNPHQLRAGFHERLRSLESRLSQSGKTVPRSLVRAIEATAPVDQLAQRNPKAAEGRLRLWVRGFALGVAPLTPARAPQIARAYRKSDALSDNDSRLLDELESELKERDIPPDGGDAER
jgi:hypothetical protein